MSKALLAHHKRHPSPSSHLSLEAAVLIRSRSHSPAPAATMPCGIPLDLVADCGCYALASIHAACGGGGGGGGGRAGAARLALAAGLVEAEALPQARRWHRRDLEPALTAAWAAVLRSLRRHCQPAAAAAGVTAPAASTGE
jgi:ribosomal protein S9